MANAPPLLTTISIHAPRMGSDLPFRAGCTMGLDFNPRSPDGERLARNTLASASRYFNPRSPDGERPATEINRLWPQLFQSTLPGWGATRIRLLGHLIDNGFQSTLPGWGATEQREHGGATGEISIHAPRMGSDFPQSATNAPSRYISIHAPRMGSDYLGLSRLAVVPHFNPRSPDGERPRFTTKTTAPNYFNPRSPDGERQTGAFQSLTDTVFQSTLPGWGATAKMDIFAHDMGKIIHFQH